MELCQIITRPEYDFLKHNKHLGDNIILLALGGSYAYGTNKEGSDIDLRGIALNSKEEILLGKDFDEVVDRATDTTIYSFNKMLNLLSKNNPNTIEILGCKPEHYLYMSPIAKELIERRISPTIRHPPLRFINGLRYLHQIHPRL